MITKKFRDFNKLDESIKINDPQILITKCEEYLIKLSVSKWKTQFFKILEENSHYTTIAYNLDDIIQDIETEGKKIEHLVDNIRIFTNRLDKKYKIEGDLSKEENTIYEELDENSLNLDEVHDKIEEFKETIKVVRKNYIDLDESFSNIRHFKIDN